MNIELALIGLSVHILVWDKLPEWGEWFPRLLQALPRPLSQLYEGWRCPYCFGFWISLALHAVTGLETLPALAEMPAYWGSLGTPVRWFLDALATATLIYFASHTLGTLSWGAARGYQATQEFKASFASGAAS